MFRNSLSPLACPFHSLSLTPAPLRRGIRYVTRFSPLLPEEVCICTTPCIAQSQGRLVGEPTRATIPRRRESRLPFILFPLLILLLFFFFSFSLFSFLRPNGSSFMIPALKTSHVVAHTSLSVFSSHGIVKKKGGREREKNIIAGTRYSRRDQVHVTAPIILEASPSSPPRRQRGCLWVYYTSGGDRFRTRGCHESQRRFRG